MRKATKPYQVIYITTFMSETVEDGDIYTFLALDEFSDTMFPPVVNPVVKTDNEFIAVLVKFFNGINEKYNPNIHSQTTTYVVNLPKPIHPIVKELIMKNDTFVYDPIKVNEIFDPIIENFNSFSR